MLRQQPSLLWLTSSGTQVPLDPAAVCRYTHVQCKATCHPPKHDAGWSSPVAREAHNLEVAGSNPVPAIFCLEPSDFDPTVFLRADGTSEQFRIRACFRYQVCFRCWSFSKEPIDDRQTASLQTL